MEKLREYNKKLLYNILPDHVAQHFLAQQAKKNDVSFFFNHIIRIQNITFTLMLYDYGQ